ncbi:methyl-accepting chemotaxis protein [Pseudoduganella plicata]|uniref:Methyl-accepting chemotaxis protein n=1 Tax=Pseudoduganella plicata TaxID=321984 RepID=A0A4P7BGV9_9BURK|nr:methyl-accepting chemotaxis protein [Pseudoduganella plicata]QBQ37493.1 methyl-accepting chemotaxis protein [Pseudoduganella plicata]GGY90653.1 methyl-accepting chemotaxis protein [Pseudoduganella plicata]
MTATHRPLLRQATSIVAGTAAGIVPVWLLFGNTAAWPATLAAAVAAGVTLLLARPRRHDGARVFADTVGAQIDAIMIGAAETSYFVDSVKAKIGADVETASAIVASSDHNARTTEQIAANVERASQVAHRVREETVAGRTEVDEGLRRISGASGDAKIAAAMMADLQQKAGSIAGFTEAISEISARTNLLALNAAIEAARAGEQGRGFAVVAGEVRQLAQRTKAATDEISAMVRAINDQAQKASSGMDSLALAVTEAAGNVQTVHTLLSNIERSSGDSEKEIDAIAHASREHVATAQVIADAITRIRDSMLSTDEELPRVASSAMALAERAEIIAGALAEADVATAHDAIRDVARQAARDVGRLFEQAIASGRISREALFDRRYRPIAGTNPPKYNTLFDAFTDDVLPPLQEALLAAMPQLAYAGAVDDHGYFPTHNRKFSQPLTGDYDVDIVNNRTKRIFSDRTGKRCGSNTRPFLLQTYQRDTGEVMHDLSAPIYVHGKHWGGFRIGYKSGTH